MVKIASATGKIILCGEYAMACTAAPGIAFPSKEKIVVRYDEKRGDGLTVIWDGKTMQPEWAMYAGQVAELLGHAAEKRVQGTIRITSDLPLGKGMGSSTAVVIALARAIIGPNSKECAIRVEDEVNPGNSGMDFAVIWEARPILYQKGVGSTPVSLPKDILQSMQLIDTGLPTETTPTLVSWVRSRQKILEKPLAVIGSTAEKIVDGRTPLKELIRAHHQAQVHLGVVTKHAIEIIEDIEKSGGAAKVIGAGGRSGGSGMILALL